MNAERTWLAALLEALERHTQALQANTAAVNSLLGLLVMAPGAPAPDAQTVLRVKSQIASDLQRSITQGQALLEQLEQLRGGTAPVDTPAPPAQTGE